LTGAQIENDEVVLFEESAIQSGPTVVSLVDGEALCPEATYNECSDQGLVLD
jgi:hypothetical protein